MPWTPWLTLSGSALPAWFELHFEAPATVTAMDFASLDAEHQRAKHVRHFWARFPLFLTALKTFPAPARVAGAHRISLNAL